MLGDVPATRRVEWNLAFLVYAPIVTLRYQKREARTTMSKPNTQENETRRQYASTEISFSAANKATYNPLEKAWGARMVRPLATEMMRFESISVGCTLVVVGGGNMWIGTMWDFAFPLRRFHVKASRDLLRISRCGLFPFTVTTQPTTASPFRPILLLPFSSCKSMKMGGQFALLDFPVEIICHILSFVSCRDLIHSSLVCCPGP